MDEGTHRCCQHRACIDEGPARAVRHVGEVGEASREGLTTVAAPIGAGPMSPAVVGVDEAVGVDDGDAGDGLVLDEDEGGGWVAAATGVAAAAAKEERRRQGFRID